MAKKLLLNHFRNETKPLFIKNCTKLKPYVLWFYRLLARLDHLQRLLVSPQ